MSGQPRRPVETPREWLRYAEQDFGVAGREMLSAEPAFHTVCFLCQSAAEKFLKGFLIAQGWSLEKTHDIVALLGLCAEYDVGLGAMMAEGAVLNEYIVAGRYPGDIAFEDMGRAQAEEALNAARHIRARVMALMGAE
ncbi:MAG TPA: HEPN domain-containing protein [Anaerolineae bacterium]|nr:HEPN domain-containing protein [Anaerolineae bacterium]